MDPDHRYQRPLKVTHAGTGLDKTYHEWLITVNGELMRKASTAAVLHREGRFAELVDFINENPK